MNEKLVVVAGGGGFIGGHLVAHLRRQERVRVRAVDLKPIDQWHQAFDDVENLQMDLKEKDDCYLACDGAVEVYNLAADMGGIGFIESHKAACMLSVLTSTHMLMAARDCGVERLFYSSSACVYAKDKQTDTAATALKEEDAYPAMPEDGYGWEKLFAERMHRHFREDYGLTTRVARFHNVYGPHGTWEGGREKAPAALCRKVVEAVVTGRHEIEIWGDGRQSRSFMYIDDCITGIERIMRSGIEEPINLGSRELVTVDQLVDTLEQIAGVELKRRYKRDAPSGVRGRNSDNTLIRNRLGWEPDTRLREGLEATYAWIYDEYRMKQGCGRAQAAAERNRMMPAA
jgi:nucleoside-diphosphate-sugar epimerase